MSALHQEVFVFFHNDDSDTTETRVDVSSAHLFVVDTDDDENETLAPAYLY